MYYVRNGWGIAKKQAVNGIQYDSKFEAKMAEELELRKRAKDIKNFEAHKAMPLICNGYNVGSYKVDFVVYHNDGTIEYIETKGRLSEDWKWRGRLS